MKAHQNWRSLKMRVSPSLYMPLLLLATVSSAQPMPQGSELQINTYTTGTQSLGDVAMDAQGNFVVVWASVGQDGDSTGVYGQRIASNGNPRGAEFRVNTYTTAAQSSPSVAMDALGSFVVVWDSSGAQDGSDASVQGQRFASDGSPQGDEFQINTYTELGQFSPSVALVDAGSFVVVWNNEYMDVRGQRFASDGTPVGGEINIGCCSNPDVAASANGFVVVWTDALFYNIYARPFSTNGTPLTSTLTVNPSQGGASPSVTSDADGDFIVVWDPGNGGPAGIRSRRYTSGGSEVGAEFRIDSNTAGSTSHPDVASDPFGNFVAVWTNSASDGDAGGIRGRRIAANDTFLGGEFQVNTYTTGIQALPTVASGPTGDLVAVWRGLDDDGFGIRGQRFSPAPSADLAITKDDGIDTASPGSEVVYTIVATNHGPSFANPVIVTDMFPPELTCDWTSVAAGGAAGNSNAAGNLSDILSMPVTSRVTYTATCTVAVGATGTLSNTATISSALPDPVPGNNAATDNDTMLRSADLSVSQSDAPDPLMVDMDVTYTIRVDNAGPEKAADVRVTVILPLTAFFVDAGGPSWSCNGSGTIFICGLAMLDVGPAPALTVTASPPPTPGVLTNQVIVSAFDFDPNLDNNDSRETTTVIPAFIFLDGFESGNTTAWTSTGANGTQSIRTSHSIVRAGF